MKWKTKALIQNIIAALPDSISYSSYSFFQKKIGGLKNFNPTKKLVSAKNVWTEIITAGKSPVGKVFFEIGTGRVPIGYFLMGAKKVITLDLNPYLELGLLIDSINYIKNNPETVKTSLGGFFDEDRFERFSKIDTSPDTNLALILNALNIEYVAPGDAREIDIENSFFDFYISCTVLEHIDENLLFPIFSEARRVLKPSGLAIHRIDYSDHFSHSDKEVSAINFLQYSDDEWARYAGNRYMYMNRLRHSDFVKLFKKTGYVIENERTDYNKSVIKLLSNNDFHIDSRFKMMSKKDLAITASWLTLNPNKKIEGS